MTVTGVVIGFDYGSVARVVRQTDSAMVSGVVWRTVRQTVYVVVSEVVSGSVTQMMWVTDCGTEAWTMAATVCGTNTRMHVWMQGGVRGIALVGAGVSGKLPVRWKAE